MPLLDIWKNTPHSVLNMNIQQILSMAGDGRLRDGSECATELREFFSEVDRETLKSYADYCLENSFEFSGFVLQDIIKEVGRRFSFDVAHGLFRGRQNRNNADGLWCGVDWAFIIEVKTTDAYTIDLDRIADYQTAYSTTEEALPNSCLIVVGRQDTATLEDQVRGSRHNWEMRIVGVEALFEALALKELSEDKTLGAKLIDLLKPREFTRVDQILSAAFDFAADRGQAVENTLEGSEIPPIVAEPVPVNPFESSEPIEDVQPYVADRGYIAEVKQLIVHRIERKHQITLSGDRVCFQSLSDDKRFAVLVSKAYSTQSKYWYGYRPRYIEFLSKSKNSFVVLGCLDSHRAYLIPVDVMNKLTSQMNTTPPDKSSPDTFFHVHLRQKENNLVIHTPKDGLIHDITSYEI